MNWLLISLVLSIVLTVALNVAVRLFPDASERAEQRLFEATNTDDDRKVRVVFPWKAMLVGSLILTIVVNVLLRMS